ncbi:rhomboid family intramembrane serine protease [Lichenihabitans sp. Uapishka_5]|uniref:rhomboid family intramembrane serine protease n=1 Tax=Lichenihabitans sp. Uapishka_5 TaxID=3037302 RepID=UPI0029E7E7E3|nr:rhomboid family intramembrane serine protease [Lichenihabitans sp. Uapishka_5]MDX7949701.1 rhomboid family intramembrane serine protease [Lichenihabitans sp. Uapishka_5]
MQSDRSEPVFNIPAVILAVLGVLVLVQAGRGLLGAGSDMAIVSRFAFVPGRLTFAVDPMGVVRHLAAGQNSAAGAQQSAWADMLLRRGGSAPWSLLTYALLHGGWTHLGLNGVWLVAFGTPVARRFGAARFLLFMAVTAVAGALAHWLCFPFGFLPVVGASAAISGLMGAAVRFMFQGEAPGADLRRVVPLGLAVVFRDRRALSFVLVWFVTNGLFGVGAQTMGFSDAPVAWQAHLGGFLAGLVLFPWFDPSGSAALAVEPQDVMSLDPADHGQASDGEASEPR